MGLGGQNRARSGFTLIEVIVAVTIFSIITAAVFSTFRAGLKAYEAAREQMNMLQSGRVFFDLLGRDLRQLRYLGPREYNMGLIERMRMRMQQRMLNPGLPGMNLNLPGMQDPEGEDAYLGTPIDMTILGANSEGGDALTFVVQQANWSAEPIQPGGQARVKYWIEDGNLFRAEGPIFVEGIPSFQWQGPVLEEGELDPNAEAPAVEEKSIEDYLKDEPRELVARDVKALKLAYGYWTPEGWKESEDWTAHGRKYRNSPPPLDPFDPNFRMLMQQQEMRPTDGVPAYVKVTITIMYGKKNDREKTFRTKIRLFQSLETHMPEFMAPEEGAMTGTPENP